MKQILIIGLLLVLLSCGEDDDAAISRANIIGTWTMQIDSINTELEFIFEGNGNISIGRAIKSQEDAVTGAKCYTEIQLGQYELNGGTVTMELNTLLVWAGGAICAPKEILFSSPINPTETGEAIAAINREENRLQLTFAPGNDLSEFGTVLLVK
ncbi:hypothetical protein QQ008_29075 [Fulvivirgaceae bacterium BMA10]|uniref:Lipocalin-like domain-containing protein n=1 Tax=Splendidivirga corallicola TaxID=3051826 RepID=A0ABT8KXD6_9BACT|nr:hypothetical protein [Fulvivirgaceae bacterium BMA10]